MEAVVDERGRVLIPQKLRLELGFAEGTVVDLEKTEGGVIMKAARRKRSSWKDLNGIRPRRTAKPEWPPPKRSRASGHRHERPRCLPGRRPSSTQTGRETLA